MSTFSTTVTKAQRNSRDYNSRGDEISICSRQHTKRPGYNHPSPFEPKVVAKKQDKYRSRPASTIIGQLTKSGLGSPKKTTVQVRPTTKRGQRSVAPTSKNIVLQELPVETFFETSCELATPRDMFIAIHSLSHGKPCVGCAYDVHSKTGCEAKRALLRERGLLK